MAAKITSAEVNRLFDGMRDLRVLVIGDVMIDAYYWGKVDRISPEAPVPVVQITQREHRLGGAANVALNVKALGATPIICAVTGNDEKGELFDRLCQDSGFETSGVVRSTSRPTTVKTRVISGSHHLLRVDEESTRPLNADEESAFLNRCLPLVSRAHADVVVFEDYNKGVLTPKVIQAISDKAHAERLPITVDPKRDNFFAYKGVTLFKPNFKELSEGLKLDIERGNQQHVASAIDQLTEQLGNALTLVTLSEHGVVIGDRTEKVFIDAHKREILDVSGAGDTVISVASLCLALGATPEAVARISNLAGGLVCEKVGVVPVDAARLREEALKLVTA